jgi:prepilin-type processing-associated H-X9-DG protein
MGMNRLCDPSRRFGRRGVSLPEVLVIGILVVLLASLLLPRPNTNRKSERIRCVNNLKQVGISLRVFQDDLQGRQRALSPLADPGLYYAWILTFSNELATPRVLICSTDRRTRVEAASWADVVKPGARNRAVSYFAGPDATEDRPGNVLFGDRSIEARAPLPPFSYRSPRAILGDLGTNAGAWERNLGWTTDAMHRNQGNLAMADGSVQQADTRRFREILGNTGDPRNRVVQPGSGPD